MTKTDSVENFEINHYAFGRARNVCQVGMAQARALKSDQFSTRICKELQAQ
jgi:hypothetical protein